MSGAAGRAVLVCGLTCIGLHAFDRPSAARAQSLDQASRAALNSSDALRADSERQAGAEARVSGAIDNFMPTLSVVLDRPLTSSITYSPAPEPSTVGLDAIPRSAPRQNSLVANLPLFDGFKRWNTLQSTWLLAEAGRHLTISRQQQVLLDTAAAYLAVLRDGRIVGFRTVAITAAGRIAEATGRQFDTKDATRTDVALTRSRVQAAEAALSRAQADLAASRQEFRRLTLRDPEQLTPPRVPRLGAETADAYAELVRAGNPQLRAAHLDVDSADHLADAARSELLPSLNLQASQNAQYGYAPGLDRITDSTVRLLARFPIYEPGALPRINEARAFARQRGYEVQDSERSTLASARASFARRKEVGTELARLRARVTELVATMRGYGIERGAGFRTVIDELNIQAELADAQVATAIVAAEYDGLTFTLAAAAGLLSAEPAGSTRDASALAGLPAAEPVGKRPAPPPTPATRPARAPRPVADEAPLSFAMRGTDAAVATSQ